MRWLLWSVLALAAVVAAIYATLWSLEDALLLHPSVCRRYLSFDPASTQHIPLKSGGLLLHCARSSRHSSGSRTLNSIRPSNPNAVNPDGSSCAGRAVVCLHGNAGSLEGMANLARLLLERFYDVYLLEPAGYGVCARDKHGGRISPSTESLVRDLHEAWSQLPSDKRPGAILWGFSMGGGTICQFLRKTHEFPAQIALLNTYYDLPMLVRDIFPLPGVSSVMKTTWNASEGIERYCSAKKRENAVGNVLIVAALDDDLIPIKHSNLLLQSVKDDCTQRELVVLPNGGHNNSVEPHAHLWLPALLPPHPTTQQPNPNSFQLSPEKTLS